MTRRALPLVSTTLALVLGVLLGAPVVVTAQTCPTLPGDAFAFLSVDAHCPVPPLVHWATPSVIFDCDYLAQEATSVDCGTDPSGCADICRAAVATWNADLPGRFSFLQADALTPVGFCDVQDGRVSIGASTKFCDGTTSFGQNVLAVTLRITVSSGVHKGEMIDSNIVVNRNFNRFDPGLFRATLAHELGHVLGLDHPDQCGHDANVLMRSAITRPSTDPCFVSAPTADDLTGAQTIYPLTIQCGDADHDGTVGVADGVQVLRAAAELSSVCTLATCDVDGDGTITIADAVNVLRAAVELPATIRCGP